MASLQIKEEEEKKRAGQEKIPQPLPNRTKRDLNSKLILRFKMAYRLLWHIRRPNLFTIRTQKPAHIILNKYLRQKINVQHLQSTIDPFFIYISAH